MTVLWALTTDHLIRRRQLMRLFKWAAGSSLEITGPGSPLDIQQPCICWRYNVARQTQSRKFLQILEDNFLVQVVGEPIRKGVLPSRGPFPLQQFCDSVNLNLCILRYQHPQISLCRAALQPLIYPFRLVSGTTLYQMQNPRF